MHGEVVLVLHKLKSFVYMLPNALHKVFEIVYFVRRCLEFLLFFFALLACGSFGASSLRYNLFETGLWYARKHWRWVDGTCTTWNCLPFALMCMAYRNHGFVLKILTAIRHSFYPALIFAVILRWKLDHFRIWLSSLFVAITFSNTATLYHC